MFFENQNGAKTSSLQVFVEIDSDWQELRFWILLILNALQRTDFVVHV